VYSISKFCADDIVIGVQHHKLAQILLSIFDPRVPKVGGSRSVAIRSMEVCSRPNICVICHTSLIDSKASVTNLTIKQAEIKLNLLELCGIGLYNRWTPPGMFTASMGIAICKFIQDE